MDYVGEGSGKKHARNNAKVHPIVLLRNNLLKKHYQPVERR
jgi:hypothetical protein